MYWSTEKFIENLAHTILQIFFGTGFENIKAKNDYVLSYNRRLRLANWVAEVTFLHFICTS